MAKVDKQLAQAIELSNGIFDDLIKADPELRNGSYTNALEEFAEAVLYKVWLENGSICAMDGAEMAGLLNNKECVAVWPFPARLGRFRLLLRASVYTEHAFVLSTCVATSNPVMVDCVLTIKKKTTILLRSFPPF